MNAFICAITHSDLINAFGRTTFPKGKIAIYLKIFRVELFITGKNENNPRTEKGKKGKRAVGEQQDVPHSFLKGYTYGNINN